MHADKRPSSPIHAHPRNPRFFFPPSSSLLCLATLLLASAVHGAAIQPDGTHTIEIGLSRSGTAQADVLANGGIYEIKVQLDAAAAAKYAIVPSTIRWTCTDGSFSGETDGQATVTWLSPDRGNKTESISVSGKLRPLGDAGGPGALLDFAGQVEAKIYEPVILLESEPQYKAEGESQTYTVSADIWAKHGDAQESIAATLTVHWLVVGAQAITADKAHFDNGQTTKTEQTTSQWVSTDLTLALPSRRGEEYMVAALVAVSEAKIQTALPSLSELVTVVGVEIEGADEPMELDIGECVTLTALAAPAGGACEWTFSHGAEYYVREDTGQPNSTRLRLTRAVQDFTADVEYTQGTVTVPSLRWVSSEYQASQTGGDGGTFESDAVTMTASGFECAHLLEPEPVVLCGIDGQVEFQIAATTNDAATLLAGITVKVGDKTPTIATGPPGTGLGELPYHFSFTIPADEVGAGPRQITITTVPDKGVTINGSPNRDLVVIHCQIEEHDAAVWCGAGEEGAVTLTATVAGLTDGQYVWNLPSTAMLIERSLRDADGKETIRIRFAQGGLDQHMQLEYSYDVGSPDGPMPFTAKRESGGQWIDDDAVFNVIALGPITEQGGTLDGLRYGDGCTLTVAPVPGLDETQGSISWEIDGAAGTFAPAGPSATTLTVFTAGAQGGAATATAKYTAHNVTTRSHKLCYIHGCCRIVSQPEYAIASQNLDLQGRRLELVAETQPAGGTYTWEVVEGASRGSVGEQTIDGNQCTVPFYPGSAGPVTVRVSYSTALGDGSVVAGTSEATFTIYNLDLNWTKEPSHDWVSVGKSITLTATLIGDPATPTVDIDNRTFDPSIVHWEACAPGQNGETLDGAKLVLTLVDHSWSVEASVRVQEQGSSDPPIEIAAIAGSISGVRLYIEGHDTLDTVDRGQVVSLTANIAHAPDTIDGTFIWSCEQAEFEQEDGTWVKGEVRAGPTVNLRFTQSGYVLGVDVAYEADIGPPPPPPPAEPETETIHLHALRWNVNAATQDEWFISDVALFRVLGFSITCVPDYGLNGYAMDVDGKPTRLEATACPSSSGAPTWTVSTPPNGGNGTADDDGPVPGGGASIWRAIFTGTQAGLVSVHAAANEDVDGDGVDDAATAQFPVYDLRMELTRKPVHNWVSVGDSVAVTATVYGDPGAERLTPDPNNIYWGVNDGDSHALNKTGSKITVTIDDSPWSIISKLKVPRQDPVGSVATMTTAPATVPRGVVLRIEGHDEKETKGRAQEITLEAELPDPPADNAVMYVWTCPQAEFKNGDQWVENAHSSSATTVTLRFREGGQDFAVGLKAEPLDPTGQPIAVIEARREQDGEWVPDDAVFSVIRAQITQPTGDPTKPSEASQFNEIAFDKATPGQLTFACKAADSGGDNNKLWWWCEHNLGSQSQQHWEPPLDDISDTFGKSAEPVATWSGLPATNSGFGQWTVHLTYQEQPGYSEVIDEDSTKIEVFYKVAEANHPPPGQGTIPNWFFYWQQTGAGDPKARYDNNINEVGLTRWGGVYLPWRGDFIITKCPGQWYEDCFYVSELAQGTTMGGIGPAGNGPTAPAGIDSFMITCRHERKHYDDFTAGYYKVDSDEDGIANEIEDADGDGVLGPGETDPYVRNTFAAQFPGGRVTKDCEYRAYSHELTVGNTIGTFDSQDWSAGPAGRNWRK